MGHPLLIQHDPTITNAQSKNRFNQILTIYIPHFDPSATRSHLIINRLFINHEFISLFINYNYE